ncbi:hypothetical protein QBC44DRAFT_375672 [Cladorrhinum sp. PSN332]|nr:hypothetical protein QBC44DRAFT_375672 [Cladorrhinum sp. PSN332]
MSRRNFLFDRPQDPGDNHDLGQDHEVDVSDLTNAIDSYNYNSRLQTPSFSTGDGDLDLNYRFQGRAVDLNLTSRQLGATTNASLLDHSPAFLRLGQAPARGDRFQNRQPTASPGIVSELSTSSFSPFPATLDANREVNRPPAMHDPNSQRRDRQAGTVTANVNLEHSLICPKCGYPSHPLYFDYHPITGQPLLCSFYSELRINFFSGAFVPSSSWHQSQAPSFPVHPGINLSPAGVAVSSPGRGEITQGLNPYHPNDGFGRIPAAGRFTADVSLNTQTFRPDPINKTRQNRSSISDDFDREALPRALWANLEQTPRAQIGDSSTAAPNPHSFGLSFWPGVPSPGSITNLRSKPDDPTPDSNSPDGMQQTGQRAQSNKRINNSPANTTWGEEEPPCSSCGTNNWPKLPGYATCTHCRDKARAKAADREARGVCKRCGEPKENPDRKHCNSCIQQFGSWRRKNKTDGDNGEKRKRDNGQDDSPSAFSPTAA